MTADKLDDKIAAAVTGKQFGTLGLIGRFKPLHIGAAVMLDAICEKAENVIIGIGSCNKYNERNPFTAEESIAMVEVYLKPRFTNYRFVRIPDFGHIPEYADGKRWMEHVVREFGPIDGFVTANPYVAELLQDKYELIHPAKLVPRENWVYLKATMVRDAMARGDDYKMMVPIPVAEYLQANNLVERFRKEFGGRILVGNPDDNLFHETLVGEQKNVRQK